MFKIQINPNIISNSTLTLRDVKHVPCELGLRADGLIKVLERCIKTREEIEEVETDRKMSAQCSQSTELYT